jgi:hypothetical protein
MIRHVKAGGRTVGGLHLSKVGRADGRADGGQHHLRAGQTSYVR